MHLAGWLQDVVLSAGWVEGGEHDGRRVLDRRLVVVGRRLLGCLLWCRLLRCFLLIGGRLPHCLGCLLYLGRR